MCLRENAWMHEPEFRPDLYRGTATYYDRFRVPYPQALIDDLLTRAGVRADDALLDLACGTGQVSFAMHRLFGEVWAVDQEPEMIGFAQQKAADARVENITFVTSTAEEFVASAESFDLVAIGNAFHRLRREVVAANVREWLRPRRCIALLTSGSLWQGEEPWQTAMSAVLRRWMTKVDAHRRIPAGWEQAQKDRPDRAILQDAGLRPVGKYQFPTAHEWTIEALIGFVYSTSFLSREALGDNAHRFEEDLRREIGTGEATERFSETIDFAYELARRPD